MPFHYRWRIAKLIFIRIVNYDRIKVEMIDFASFSEHYWQLGIDHGGGQFLKEF